MTGAFRTTRWSLVAAAADTERAREALSELVQIYHFPLYAHARRLGLDAHAAEDAVQVLWTRLYTSQDLGRLVEGAGRFRAFLRVALGHTIANQRAAERTLRRGEGRVALGVDLGAAEARFLTEVEGREEDPAATFERTFARTLIARALETVGDEYRATGRGALFGALARALEGGAARAEAEAELGLEPVAFRVALHRLRQRFGEALRREVRELVKHPEAPEDLEDELRSVLGALAR